MDTAQSVRTTLSRYFSGLMETEEKYISIEDIVAGNRFGLFESLIQDIDSGNYVASFHGYVFICPGPNEVSLLDILKGAGIPEHLH
jgi:hypothetical protein